MKPEVFAKRLTLNYAIKGHDSSVRGLAISRDDRIIVSGSFFGKTIKIWNALDGTLLRTILLPGESASGIKLLTPAVSSIALSPDGRIIVCGQMDSYISTWNTLDGTLLHMLRHDVTSPVGSVVTSQDGRIIVAGGGKEISVWNASDGTPLYTLTHHTNPYALFISVAISSDRQIIISAGGDWTIKVWSALDGTLLHTLIGNLSPVQSVALSSDGRTLVSGSEKVEHGTGDGLILPGASLILVWNTQDGKLLRVIWEFECGMISVAISPDGSTIVSGSEDNTIKVWDAKNGQLLRTIQGLEDSVNSIIFNSDGRTLVSGSGDGTIRVWGMR